MGLGFFRLQFDLHMPIGVNQTPHTMGVEVFFADGDRLFGAATEQFAFVSAGADEFKLFFS